MTAVILISMGTIFFLLAGWIYDTPGLGPNSGFGPSDEKTKRVKETLRPIVVFTMRLFALGFVVVGFLLWFGWLTK
jgi:hypothetical protein